MAVLVTTAVVSAVLIASLLSAWQDASRRFVAKRVELQGIAAAIATATAHPMATGDFNNVARTLSAVGRIPGLTYARVTDASGHSVHQYGFGVVVTREIGSMPANVEIGPFSVLYLATYPVMVPIISGGERIGELTVIADLSGLRGAVVESLEWSLITGVMAVLIGLLMSWRLQRGISGPVAALTAAMQDVTRTKDFSRRVQAAGTNEIGVLVGAFNGMLDEVRARDEALAQHRGRLEAEVRERTAEFLHAKQEAECANAAKSDFLATMSHEIRTPMNGMLVMAELMTAANLPPRLQRYADVLLTSGQTLLALINDILDFSKIEAGKLDLEHIPVQPRRIIDDVMKLFHERAVSHGLDLAAHIGTNVPRVIAADPIRLSQILSNVVNNALKFTQAGHVAVRVSFAPGGGADRGDLQIEVSDTGIGIAAEKLGEIFEAFAQADQSTTRQFGGTGIGLSICQRLVRAMEGEIAVVSAVGRGSTFTVTLPVQVLEPAATPESAGDGGLGAVAVVLEATATRDVLCRYAREHGFDVTIFAPEAFSVSLSGAFKAVFARSAVLQRHAEASGHRGVDASETIIVALCGLGDVGVTELGGAGSADLQLGLPLSCEEVSQCFTMVVAGRAAVAAKREDLLLRVDTNDTNLAFAGMRVLAADDSAVNREVLSEALARLGVKITCVPDGVAAVAAATSGDFDVVLMDGNMPIMDGFAATREIRKWEAEASRSPMPIVALTAHVVGAHAEAWRDAGMSGQLTKPYTLKALQACLERALAGRALPSARALVPPTAPQPSSLIEAIPLLDAAVMDGIREMQRPGDDLAGRIVSLYADHAQRALTLLLAAQAGGNALEISERAHALRSQSLNVGAVRVAQVCGDLEEAARRGDLSTAAARCAAVALAIPATIAALLAQQVASASGNAGGPPLRAAS